MIKRKKRKKKERDCARIPLCWIRIVVRERERESKRVAKNRRKLNKIQEEVTHERRRVCVEFLYMLLLFKK